MKTLPDIIKVLDGVHDVVLRKMLWEQYSATLDIEVYDIYANFVGFPEYKGPVVAAVRFGHVSRLDIQVDFSIKALMIYEVATVRKGPDLYSATIMFSPGGKIEADFKELALIEVV